MSPERYWLGPSSQEVGWVGVEVGEVGGDGGGGKWRGGGGGELCLMLHRRHQNDRAPF